MIQCNDCGFSVNETMKFALMQNSCPSCGNNLFSNRDTNLISMIQGKLSTEKFSGKLTDELMYDISLFIFNEFKQGIGKSLVDEGIANLKSAMADNTNENDEGADSESSDLRREIEGELEEEISQLTNSGDVIDEEIFSKAERLKKLREQQLAGNPKLGKKVVTSKRSNNSFKGISRS